MARLDQLLRSAKSSSNEAYCPDQYDIIYLDFDPIKGHEQAGHRPALVLSPRIYNERARLCLVCPITTKPKNYPFEVPLTGGGKIVGAVISDQIKCLSWKERRSEFVEAASDEDVKQVLAKIKPLLSL